VYWVLSEGEVCPWCNCVCHVGQSKGKSVILDVMSQVIDMQCNVSLAHSNIRTVCDKGRYSNVCNGLLRARDGYRMLRLSDFQTFTMKVVRLSAICTAHSAAC
jgi:hypothetical protein